VDCPRPSATPASELEATRIAGVGDTVHAPYARCSIARPLRGASSAPHPRACHAQSAVFCKALDKGRCVLRLRRLEAGEGVEWEGGSSDSGSSDDHDSAAEGGGAGPAAPPASGELMGMEERRAQLRASIPALTVEQQAALTACGDARGVAVRHINGMPHATAHSYVCSTNTVLDSLVSPDPREARLPAAAYAAAGAVTHSYGHVMRVPGAALRQAARDTRDSHVMSAVICVVDEAIAAICPGSQLAEGRFAHCLLSPHMRPPCPTAPATVAKLAAAAAVPAAMARLAAAAREAAAAQGPARRQVARSGREWRRLRRRRLRPCACGARSPFLA
jgi:hypothetical protein